MRKRHRTLVLVESREHFQKDFLGEILLGHAPGKMRPHDADDLRIELLNELAGRRLIARAYPFEATGKIERFFNHGVCREGNTWEKTAGGSGSYQ